MSKNNSATNISIIAVHYSTNEILEQFIKDHSFANEIIILDLKQEEPLLDEKIILKKANANTIEKLYRESINSIKNDWFLFLYTTYSIPTNLKLEILDSINTNKDEGYNIKKEFEFFGENLKFGTLERAATACLLKKNTSLNLLENKKVNLYPTLKNKIINHSYTSFDSYNSSLTLLNTIAVEQLFAENVKPKNYNFLLKPFYFFIKNYFFKGEVLNGKNGYILTYIHSFAILKKELQLWLKYKNSN